MHEHAQDYIDAIGGELRELERATARLADTGLDEAHAIAAMHAARNAFSALEGFLRTLPLADP
jgi:hypothetical protein